MTMEGKFCGLCTRMKDEHSIFSYLSNENLRKVCHYFECVNVSAGETLWNEGDDCDYVAFIISGQIEVKKQTEFEGKHVVVGLYSGNAIVGALCILDNSRRAVTAVALEDTSLATISRENFEKLISEHPKMGGQLMKGMLLSVSVRLRNSFERLSRFF